MFRALLEKFMFIYLLLLVSILWKIHAKSSFVCPGLANLFGF
jgi:hypothetical protein